MSIFITLCLFGVCYFIYKSVSKNRLTPEQKELLKVATVNNITDQKTIKQLINKEITLEQAKKIQDDIKTEQKRKAKAKAARDAKAKAEREAKEKAEWEAKVKAEKKLIEKLSSANNRTYFCYSLVNTESILYLINPENNSVIESSRTNLSTLYKEGWRLIDVDKTGKTAQLDAFNSIVRLKKA